MKALWLVAAIAHLLAQPAEPAHAQVDPSSQQGPEGPDERLARRGIRLSIRYDGEIFDCEGGSMKT